MAGLPLQSSKLSLLQLVENACLEVGIPAPQTLFGNTDPQAMQLLALAQREGREFYKASKDREGWQCLRKEYTFNIVASDALTGSCTEGSATITNIPSTDTIAEGQVAVGSGYIAQGAIVQSIDSPTQITLNLPCLATATSISFYCGQDNYPLPDDIDHFMPMTFWDRNFRWQLLGPLEAQEWQVLKSGISPTGPRRRFRIMANAFYIDPVPFDNGSVIAYEYYSNGWSQSEGGISGTPQPRFMADTDNYCLDDDCLTLGLIWRYLRSKRFSSDVEFQTYSNARDIIMARDGASRSLPLNASASGLRLLNETNIPDTGFGS